MSRGKMPYQNLTNLQASEEIKAGKKLEKPSDCPDEIYEIMLRCWQMDPLSRPTFENIVFILKKVQVE